MFPTADVNEESKILDQDELNGHSTENVPHPDSPFRHQFLNNNVISENDVDRLDHTYKRHHCNALHFLDELTSVHFNLCYHNEHIWFTQPRVNTEIRNMMLTKKTLLIVYGDISVPEFATLFASLKNIPENGPYIFKIQGYIHRFISDCSLCMSSHFYMNNYI